ncbi:MAG: B12-binding domain-containing radical SAM protein, partial [Planctomycetota bacterium]
MKRILLVSPKPTRFEPTQYETYLKLPFVKTRGFFVPLPIAAVAALTPDDFEVDLWDEPVHGPIDGSANLKSYDLVGVTGFVGHLPRANAIAALCRREGIPVVIGGPGVSKQPHFCQDAFDHLFLGEAEFIWPQFLADWKEGKARRVYRQVGGVDLALAPPPRWDSLADCAQYYRAGAVQTSRGCPFDCEFCDVRLLFGAHFRTKPIDNVLQEVANLEKLGFSALVFCDDNFVGSPRYAKELLRELISLNNSFRQPLRFAAEMSLNIARDEELLELLADAGFAEVAIGVESPNQESLKEAGKRPNYGRNVAEDIRKIQSYGIPVRGSLIAGFDHDGKDIFDQLFQFLQESCLTVPDFRALMAAPGTRMWMRFRKEGRLLDTDTRGRFFGDAATTNIIPKTMTRTELQASVMDLKERVYDWDAFAVRAKGFVSQLKRRPDLPKQRREWKLLIDFTRFLLSSLVDWKTRRIILDILWHTRKQAPFMLPAVARMILRQFSYANV